MSKANTPAWHEPVTTVGDELNDPIEDSVEVGSVALVDGPIDPVPFRTEPRSHQETDKKNGFGEKIKDVTQKTQEGAQSVVDKVTDTVQDKVQDVTKAVADNAASAKSAVSNTLETVKSSASNAVPATTGALSGAAQSAGSALWTIIQRNPLQAIAVFASLIWLFRNNKEASNQPPVSLNDAAKNVGSVAGQVQVAANNLGSQVQQQALNGSGWFSKTLQENPLAIGAMAVVFGAGLGFAVPESGYENQLLGKKRDELASKAQEAAQDLTQKVTTVAQTVVQEAVETAKEEAKNQGLTA